MKKHYAFLWWIYARHSNTGFRIGRYYYFLTRQERDKWVEGGNPYLDAGNREAIPARDSELRMLQRIEKAQDQVGEYIRNWEDAR
jgi:hypothetical protein